MLLHHGGGAHDDIRRQTRYGRSPLCTALRNGHFHVAQWLTRNEALSSPRDAVDGGGIDDRVVRNDLDPNKPHYPWRYDKRLPILSWAQDAVTNHDNIKEFLTAPIVSASTFRCHPQNEYATRSKRIKISPSSSSLEVFNGKSDILELVAAYVERKPKPQELRIFRHLMDRLPAFIADKLYVQIEKCFGISFCIVAVIAVVQYYNIDIYIEIDIIVLSYIIFDHISGIEP